MSSVSQGDTEGTRMVKHVFRNVYGGPWIEEEIHWYNWWNSRLNDPRWRGDTKTRYLDDEPQYRYAVQKCDARKNWREALWLRWVVSIVEK